MTREQRLQRLAAARAAVRRLAPEFAAEEARFEEARTRWHTKMRELAIARATVSNLEAVSAKKDACADG